MKAETIKKLKLFEGFAYLVQRRLRFGREAMQELGNITKSKNVSLESKGKIIRTPMFPITFRDMKV